MTAKHRKSKNNHKHEENFFKNDVVESEVRPGANSSSVHLALILAVVIGGAVGLWFCFQQHQTLSQLTDSVAGMQMKIMKLQSAHEEFRQSGTKVRRCSLSSPPTRSVFYIFMKEQKSSYNQETCHATASIRPTSQQSQELQAWIRFPNARSLCEDQPPRCSE